MSGCSQAQQDGERSCHTPTPKSIRIPENVRTSYASGKKTRMLIPEVKVENTMYLLKYHFSSEMPHCIGRSSKPKKPKMYICICFRKMPNTLKKGFRRKISTSLKNIKRKQCCQKGALWLYVSRSLIACFINSSRSARSGKVSF